MPKRKVAEIAGSNTTKRKEQKRSKTTYLSIVADLTCPIVRELPVQPVVASDGRIYEKHAIEAHIAQADRTDSTLRSPVTNEGIRDTTMPVIHVANTIRALIEDGVIKKDEADRWTNLRATLKEAEAGNTSSIYAFARFLEENGILQGAKDWYMKGAGLDDVRCMACLGPMLPCVGYRQHAESVSYLGRAAERGSDLAAYSLGKAYFTGFFGGTLRARRTVNKYHSLQAKEWLVRFSSGRCILGHFSSDRTRREAMKDTEDMIGKLNCNICNTDAVPRYCPHMSHETRALMVDNNGSDDYNIVFSNFQVLYE
jgi:hypothetical protein